jgi:GTP-binding protein
MERLEVVAVSDEADYRDINMEIEQGVFVLSGKQLKKIFDSTNFNDYGSLRYLYQYLVKNGIVDQMKVAGLEEGDTVRIYDFEFEYIEED